MDDRNEGSPQLTRRAQLALLFAVGAWGAGVALASNAPIVSSANEPRTVRVEYGDLNLASKEGRDGLARRIHQAADIVCSQPEGRILAMWSEYRKCMLNATDSAWSQIKTPAFAKAPASEQRGLPALQP
jgi:UrcA family protein